LLFFDIFKIGQNSKIIIFQYQYYFITFMTTVKTIKDVNEDTWLEFKSMAARNKMKMGKLFEDMVDDYKKETKKFWDDILKGPPTISEGEAKAMEETVKEIRKEYGFRYKKGG
jgi:hypothetical protein